MMFCLKNEERNSKRPLTSNSKSKLEKNKLHLELNYENLVFFEF